MTTTVSITEEVKEKLVKIAADFQKKKGRRVDLNEAIEYLISPRGEKETRSSRKSCSCSTA